MSLTCYNVRGQGGIPATAQGYRETGNSDPIAPYIHCLTV